MAERRPPRWLSSRRYVQLASFLFANSWILTRFKGFCYPGLNCWACPTANFACPLGALQMSASGARLGLVGGAPLWRLLPLYVLGLLFTFSAVFGRMMCGWICPTGWAQELIGRRRAKWRTPRWSWYIRYVVLIVLVIIIPFYTQEAWFCKLCPTGGVEAAIPQPLLDPTLRSQLGLMWGIKIAIIVLTIVAAYLWRRPFCSVICPLGAIFSLMHRFSAWRIDYSKSKCINCMWCVKTCPQGIDPRRDLNGHACVGCLECEKCPHDAIHSHPMWKPTPDEIIEAVGAGGAEPESGV